MASTTTPKLGSAHAVRPSEIRHPQRGLDDQNRVRQAMRAREVLLTGGQWNDDFARRSGIRPQVLDSWRRSLRYGLRPDRVEPTCRPDAELDGQLARIVQAVVEQRKAVLEQSLCALSITDRDGTLLRRWVMDRQLARWMDEHNIIPSVSVDETAIGTFSAICLLDGNPVHVRGPEHFSEAYLGVTSAGAPIIHPVSRRIVGSLIATCRSDGSSPILLAWVTELAAEVQRRLLESSSTRERLLLEAFLAENRDVRHPLIVLDEQTIITNATAARVLASVDQARLWEHAAQAIRQRNTESQMVMTDGSAVSVTCHEVNDGTGAIGAVLKVRLIEERKTACDTPSNLEGLAGTGLRWRELGQRVRRTGVEWALITGERGTGRLAVARAMAEGAEVHVIDAIEASAQGPQHWLARLDELVATAEPESVVVVRHVDELDWGTAAVAAGLIERCRALRIRVLATARERADQLAPNGLLDLFTAWIEVPPLRDRFEDLPVLLESLTAAVLEQSGRQSKPVRWMPDAVQTLTRLEWHSNIASLRILVRDVLRDNRNGYISARDLPANVVAAASRRKLIGLELVEATTIIAAMREAGGNKNRAADALGIARSTLYRKVRALGIDLSTMAF
ncbi:sigma-54-dependent Fis family transcriptional regulator [Nocardia sp. NPDC059240]|uniref:sigma-54-dependent Fis family transcriptional regulator n=1 Tax=Nocardia sp. NPDC059240 TaxID=3346786 RepID=UPI0036C62912